MATVIKNFETKNSYVKLIEKALFSYLWEGIYKPMFEILKIKPVASNAESVIIEALKNGNIYYLEGGFKAKKKFTNAQSLELEKWGAKWDSWQKMYRIPFNKLPQSVLVALSENKILTENKINALRDFLREVEANMPYIIESMVFDSEVITILDDAGKEIKKTVKHLNIIEPDLTEQQKQEIARSYTQNMRDYVIKDFQNERIPQMRQRVLQATLEGYRLDKVEKILKQEFGFMASKAKFLAYNETNIALAEVKRAMYQAMGFDKFVWQTRADARVRDLHQHLNGTVWRYDNPPVIDERTGQKGLPGETYNCLLGDMVIVSPFLHNRIFKRKFTGETTEIVLPMGTLKVTPNHPILTDRGWIAAKDINIGDNIAKISDKTFFGTGIKPQNIKTTIEEFFSFYSVLFNNKRVSHSDFDFHGDISVDKQVEVINIENKLWDHFKPSFNKLSLKNILTKANELGIFTTSNRAFYKAFPFGTLTSDSFISSLDKIFSFFFGSETHTVEHSLRAIAWLDTLLFECCGYTITRDSEFLSKLFNTPSGTIKFYQLILWDILFNCFSKNIIPLLSHSFREMSCATSETLGDFSHTQPTFIEFDTVIDKFSSKSSSVHIYNLENSNHWYLTENYITKNCRCVALPYSENTFIDRKFVDDDKQMKKVYSAKQSEKRLNNYLEAYYKRNSK